MDNSVKESSELKEARTRVRSAYDPQLFQEAGQRLIALLHEHLRRIESSQEKVLNWHDPVENIAAAGQALDESVARTSHVDVIAAFTQRSVPDASART